MRRNSIENFYLCIPKIRSNDYKGKFYLECKSDAVVKRSGVHQVYTFLHRVRAYDVGCSTETNLADEFTNDLR